MFALNLSKHGEKINYVSVNESMLVISIWLPDKSSLLGLKFIFVQATYTIIYATRKEYRYTVFPLNMEPGAGDLVGKSRPS